MGGDRRRGAGTGFRPIGSLTLARSPGELAALEALVAAGDAKRRGVSLLEPAEVRAVNPALQGEVLGGLLCERDAAVEPRLTLGALRGHLERSGAYRFVPGTEAREVLAHQVVDQHGVSHKGDLVVCCPGARPSGAIADALRDAPVRRVRLQMLETEPFDGVLSTAVADGDSLRCYPAFAPSRTALGEQDELAAAWRAQLLMVHRLGGHLTIGDTHAYEEPFFFASRTRRAGTCSASPLRCSAPSSRPLSGAGLASTASAPSRARCTTESRSSRGSSW